MGVQEPIANHTQTGSRVYKLGLGNLTLHFHTALRVKRCVFKDCCYNLFTSGVARAFPGGRLAHQEGQNEDENK